MHAHLQWSDLAALVLTLGMFVVVVVAVYVIAVAGGQRARASVLPARTGEQARPCRTCRNFDLEAGQKALRSHDVFGKVMANVPPHDLGRKVVVLHAGETDESVQIIPSGPKSADWSEFGACTLHNEAVWAGYHCNDFVPLSMLRRFARAS